MKIGYHSPVRGMHTRPVSIKNARDLYFKAVLAAIIEEESLGATLSFIVAGAKSNRVDVPPVVLRLGMNRRVAIDFACRCLENTAPQPLGETQHVDGSVHRRLRRLHRIVLIMHRRSRASEIIDFVRLEYSGNVTSWRMNSNR